MKLFSNLFIVAAVYFSTLTLAQHVPVPGHFVGGGGDADCAEFMDTQARIASAIFNIGQTRVDAANKQINVQALVAASRDWTCEPVDSLDRIIRTDPLQKTSRLVSAKWRRLDETSKVRLSAHELCVRAELEKGDQYFISETVSRLASSHRLMSYLKASQVIHNSDGSETLVKPFVRIFDKVRGTSPEYRIMRANTAGVCRYLGFEKDLSVSSEFEEQGSFAYFGDSGNLQKFWHEYSQRFQPVTSGNKEIIQSITCK